MATTPQYFWPYQALTDPPNGAVLGQQLALAIEATVAAINASVVANAAATVTAPIARLRRTAAQTIATGTFTPIVWQTADADTHSGWNSGVNPERWTAPLSGYYLAIYHAAWAANATGIRTVRLLKNGGSIAGTNTIRSAVSGGAGEHFGDSTILPVTAGDYFTVDCFQNTGGNLDQEIGADACPRLDITYLRPL